VGRRYPTDDNVSAVVWAYLQRRYPPAEARERRERIIDTLKRLRRRGTELTPVHHALLRGCDVWNAHQQTLETRPQVKAAVARARKDVARALTSLRRLLPAGYSISDNMLFELRHAVLNLHLDTTPGTPGRPWKWKQETDSALKEAGVTASDRRELTAALGFLPDE
jgi:hypothetical protein